MMNQATLNLPTLNCPQCGFQAWELVLPIEEDDVMIVLSCRVCDHPLYVRIGEPLGLAKVAIEARAKKERPAI